MGRPELITLALAGGWIIRAIEEYGVGGPHIPDSERFLLIGSSLATDIGQALVSAGEAPEGVNATDAIRHVIGKYSEAIAEAKAAATGGASS